MKVILVSGKAQAGKDTLATYLEHDIKHRGKTSIVLHFGDLLKFVCRTYLGWDGKKDEYGRDLLQFVGTEVVRGFEEDFWAKFVADMVAMLNDGRRFDERKSHDLWDYVIIPDYRFKNEMTVMQNYGFDVVHVRVTRDDTSSLTEQQKRHSSETSIDDERADYIIENNGKLDDLHVQAHNLITEISK